MSQTLRSLLRGTEPTEPTPICCTPHCQNHSDYFVNVMHITSMNVVPESLEFDSPNEKKGQSFKAFFKVYLVT